MKDFRWAWEEMFKFFAQANPDDKFHPLEIRNVMGEIEEKGGLLWTPKN